MKHAPMLRYLFFLIFCLFIILGVNPPATADTIVSGGVYTDTTWTAAGSPYIVTSNVFIQGTDGPDGVTTLTIEPGTTVKFETSKYMRVGYYSGSPGALVAIGTAANPIVFTSNQPTPAPGDWGSIHFQTTTHASSILEHCQFEYAGGSMNTSIYVANASPTITNTTINYSSQYDLYYYGTSGGTVSGCTFTSGVNLASTNLTVSFSNNTFNHNTTYPTKAYADGVHALVNGNNTYNDPANSYVEVFSGNVTKDATWTGAVPIYIANHLTVQGTDGADGVTTLTLEPGVTIKMNSAKYFKVGHYSGSPGSLMAQGTATDPVVFTSNTANPVAGDWGSIQFYGTAHPTSILEHCIVEYSGSSMSGAIYVANNSPTISNTTINHSSQYDLYYTGTVGGTVTGCTFTSGVYLGSTNLSVNFTNNTFNHNNNYTTKAYADGVHALANGNNTFNDPANSYIEVFSGNVTKDATWTGAVPLYFPNYFRIQGTDGADGVTTLTLEPGTTIQFNTGKYIDVGYYSGSPGALVAQGTAESPVVFTSNKPSPSPGDWAGINFYATADASSKLDHCVIQYSGSSMSASIYITNTSIDISNTVIENGSLYDIYYYGTAGGNVSDSTFNSGIFLSSANHAASFTNNTFHHNSAYPTYTIAANVAVFCNATNTFVDSENAYITVSDRNLTKDTTWSGAVPIYLNDYLIVQGDDGADGMTTLTLEPGATLKFNAGKFLQVGAYSGHPGALVAQGTAENPIVFTSNQPTPAAGDWDYIHFYSTSGSSSSLAHCRVEYAGRTNRGSIQMFNSAPNIANTTVQNGKGYDLIYTGTSGGSLTESTLNHGLHIQTANINVDFTGNTINQDNAFPIKAYADNVHALVNGNTFNNVNESSYLEVLDGNVTLDATWSATIPIYLVKNATVIGTDGADGITTLTIEPGAKVLFNQGRTFFVGANPGDPGALIAHGTPANMITFTSNQASPTPGYWGSLYFSNTTDDATTSLKYCIVEYAGTNGQGVVQLYDAKPSIENSIIRYSSTAGVYAYGGGSNDALISCNTISNNLTHGIYVGSNALPIITGNNFIDNAQHGLYNTNTDQVMAENNWWGDALGPNTGGDSTSGDVDTDPWLTEENNCIVVEVNNPPDTPAAPVPADQAVRVALSSGAFTLQWIGGDPDPEDNVTFDLQWGTSAGALALTSQGIVGNQHQVAGLSDGTTYYWQITAKDSRGLETTGPVWRFTSDGDPPDLTVNALSTNPPGNLQSGQSVTFTATLLNTGSGPVVDPFSASLTIDGTPIGEQALNEVVLAGNTIDATWTWTYGGGDPTIEVFADSQGQVVETEEGNNLLTVQLSEVSDITPPALVSSGPSDGDFVQQIQQIAFTLMDTQSPVDDAAVISSVTVTESDQQPVSGTLSELNDTFTFVPATLPLADSLYTVSLTASDSHGNSQAYVFVFTIDATAPGMPGITGATVTSGTIAPRPTQNIADQFRVDLTGTRDPDTSVWINGVLRVNFGDQDWSVPLDLLAGDNAVEVWLQDRAGNRGPSEWVDITVTAADAVTYEYDAAGRVKSIHSNQQ